MMMDERPETETDDDGNPAEAGVKSMEGAEPGTTQRSSGSGDTRRSTAGSGDTR